MQKSPVRKFSAVPTYTQIAEDLRKKVADRKFDPNTPLPSRRALAQEYGVALGTIQLAMADLLASGVVHARGRWGTFVSGPASSAAPPVYESSPPPNKTSKFVGTVAIVTHTKLEEDYEGWVHANWKNAIANSLEKAIAREGGSTHYINMYDPKGSRSLNDALMLAATSGASALAIVFQGTAPELVSSIHRLNIERLPTVHIGEPDVPHPIYCVYYDDHDAGYQAAAHLIPSCEHLVYISPFSADWVSGRLSGVRQALQYSGWPPDKLMVHIGPEPVDIVTDLEQAGYEYSLKVLAKGLPSNSGIVATNDKTAYGVIRAASELGLQLRRDYLIVGFDDYPMSKMANLTSMAPPLEMMGQEAARLLVAAMQGEKSSMRACLHSHLVVRSSSRWIADDLVSSK